MINVFISAAARTRLASLVLALVLVPPVRADALVSPWVEGFNNKVRLMAGRAGSEAKIYAGLEISMPPDWKTYWRNPGEAGGVAPEFDFAGSENLEKAEVLYPAPHRLVDPKAGENIGYKEHVTFPIAVTAKDASKPVSLRVKATYGVCKDICVPAEAELSIQLTNDAPGSSDLQEALAAVPIYLKPDGSTKVEPTVPVLKHWFIDQANKPMLHLDVIAAGQGDGADVFLFSPDGLYVPMTKRVSASAEGAKFEADLTDGVDIKDLKGKFISVTLVGTKGQSETIIQIP